jgi:hypothetical protein
MNITAPTLMSLKTYSLERRNHKQRLITYRRERSLSLGPERSVRSGCGLSTDSCRFALIPYTPPPKNCVFMSCR